MSIFEWHGALFDDALGVAGFRHSTPRDAVFADVHAPNQRVAQ